MKALIMAGGKGTRLTEITKNLLPKPMVELNGKKLLEYAIENLIEYGVTEIFLSIGFMHEVIEEYFNKKKYPVKIHFIVEDEPLGSGGALYLIKDQLDDDFVVCNGDALFNINIKKMLDFHKSNNSIATLFTHPNYHPYDSDLIICDDNNKVLKIDKKGTVRDYYYKNNVNAGFFIINPKALYYFDTLKKVSMENDFIATLLADGKNVFAYKSTEYIKDVGTPERYFNAINDLNNNLPEKKNPKNKQKAMFLDRDGTINVYKGFLNHSDKFELIEGVADAIKLINKSEYLTIIISNQPVIARGECTFEEQENIFKKLETLLGKEGAYIDGYYYCPHHPHSGYDGEIKELKIECDCRKPKIGMLKQAEKDFNLDLQKCIFVGDTDTDVKTGKNAGITTIRVPSPAEETHHEKEDFCFENLLTAMQTILK